MSYALELQDVRKNFGKTEIIRGVNLAVKAGERVAVIASEGGHIPTPFACFHVLRPRPTPPAALLAPWPRR